jgi:hypothetical protein
MKCLVYWKTAGGTRQWKQSHIGKKSAAKNMEQHSRGGCKKVPAASPALLARSEFRDLCSLHADSGHEPGLAEEKRLDSLVHCGRGNGTGESLVRHHQRGRGTELEAVGTPQVFQGFFVHEEQSVAIFLDADLQAVGCRGRGRKRKVVAKFFLVCGVAPLLASTPNGILGLSPETELFDQQPGHAQAHRRRISLEEKGSMASGSKPCR